MRIFAIPVLPVAFAVILASFPIAAIAFQYDLSGSGPFDDGASGTLPAPSFSSPVRVSGDTIIEPSVRVDSTGVIYVAGARGFPNPSAMFRSEDGGRTWLRLPTPPGQTGPVSVSASVGIGAEPELSLAADDTLYVTELYVGNVIVYKFTNHGRTFAGMNVIAESSTAVDRQWQVVGKPNAAGGHEMFVNTNDVGRGVFQYYSPDAILVPATKPKSVVNGGGPSFPPTYDPASGFVYTPIVMAGGIWVGRTSSAPLELAQVNMPKWLIANVGDAANQFPVAAVDGAGTVYVAWSHPTGGTHDVWYAASRDQGRTWTTPVRVSTGGSNTYPWMDAGRDGRLVIAWYHADAPGDPEQVTGPWRVQVAQIADAYADAPQKAVTTLPQVVQEGYGICLSGTGCSLSATGSRALGDYFQVAIGPDGMAHVAYAAAVNGANAKTYHVKQVGGEPS